MARTERKKKFRTPGSSWQRAVREVLRLASPKQRILVVGGLFVASMFELLGLAMIIPLLAAATMEVHGGKGAITNAIRRGMEAIGLPFDPLVILLLIVVGFTLKAAVAITTMRYVTDIVAGISNGFQVRLLRNLLRARWSFFIRQPLGRLVHATGSEAAAVGESFLNISNILASILQASLFLAVAALISWKLALVALAIGFLMFFSFGRLVRSSRKAARRHRAQMRQLAGNFTDAMIGIKPIRAMGRTERFGRLFESDARGIAQTLRARVISSEYVTEMQEPVIGVLLAVAFYYATQEATLHPTDVIIMAILLVRTISILSPLQRVVLKFIQSYDLYRSLVDLLDETAAAAENAGGTRPPVFEREIAFERVSFGYGQDRLVLRDLDLVIPRGGITALAGPSGVGKSTAVDLIAGLYEPQAGSIRIDGIDLREFDLQRWRHLLGYVPQEVTLFHDTVFRNVSLWEDGATEADVIEALQVAGAWSFVSELPFGLHQMLGERGHRLSGGQRQRISIARALVHKPKLLILDEATTGLDPQTESEICAVVQRLCVERGLTVLAISHQPAWQQIADRVYTIVDGTTVQTRPVVMPLASAG
ncbi:MAG TPA: ABC transporter ATP-binding protein [Rhodospirillales bacterium]|nr:ABC transporter ATP-binding protein [Rhodospirillales bacterium]